MFLFKENQTSCASFLQTGTWSLSNYSQCFPKNFSSFSEHRIEYWSSFREVFNKSSCSAKWYDEIYFCYTNGQKQESVTCKFTKKNPSQAFFKKSDHKFRAGMLKSISWPSKHFNVVSTLVLGWYDVATSYNVKLTLSISTLIWTTLDKVVIFNVGLYKVKPRRINVVNVTTKKWKNKLRVKNIIILLIFNIII